MSQYSIGLVIPTKNAQATLSEILTMLKTSSFEFSILIVDSSSDDSTVSIANKHNIQVKIIPQADFNHGATREYARNLINTDIVVFLTQDAIPVTVDLIERLVKPLIENDDVVISYGRQIPHDGADVFEAFPREFNYQEYSHTRSIEDIDQYGVYTFFCSNSCAAYKNVALNTVGGFQTTLTNEDYFTVARLLQKGYKIAYVADAVVKHSHSYTLCQEFQRYFDTGYARAENPIVQKLVGQAESRGMGFIVALLKKVWNDQPFLIFYAVVQSLIKWLGYRVGFYGSFLPLNVRKKLSQQSYYWSSKYY
ncbi:MAG: glycosyltransferase [Methylomarinum sp.]|nr:glycosyltransferase [Methylomarinum sp.]